MARTAKLSVMVAKEIKDDLAKISDQMGMTESALVAYIVGQWVMSQKAVYGKLLEATDQILQAGISAGSGEGTDRA